MKCTSACGSSLRTNAISGSEAQSKWRTPPAQTARKTRGSGLHFTAYSTSPGKAATKQRDAADMTAGLRQTSGSAGRSRATTALMIGRELRFAARSTRRAFDIRTTSPRQGGDTRTRRPSDKERVNAAAERCAPERHYPEKLDWRARTSHRVPDHIRIPQGRRPTVGRLGRKRRVTS